MKIRNVTKSQLYAALNLINEKYQNNITFNRIEQKGNIFHVTLRVVNANQKKGAIAGRKLNQSWIENQSGIKSGTSACWHVHGDFFETLLYIAPNAIIDTMLGRIDKNGGNWQDRNIGSIMNPIYYSEACECP
jgi:hypothetical protein